MNATLTASTPEHLRNASNLPPKPAEVIVAEAYHRQRAEIESLLDAIEEISRWHKAYCAEPIGSGRARCESYLHAAVREGEALAAKLGRQF